MNILMWIVVLNCSMKGGKLMSPFANREGEEFVCLEYHNGHYIGLRALQEAILICVNDLTAATSLMITRCMQGYGYMVMAENVRANIKILVENEYLERNQFVTKDGHSSYSVYSLGFRGKSWLRISGVPIKCSSVMATRDTESIKKILASNQCAIELGILMDYKYQSYGLIKDMPKCTYHNIRMLGVAKKNEDFIYIEPIRFHKDYQKEILIKLESIVELRKVSVNKCLDCNIRLIYVAEDYEMMMDIMKILSFSNYKNQEWIFFTYDRKLVEDTDNKVFRLSMREEKENE